MEKNRDVYIKLVVTEEEREKIKECSEYNNISISDLLRLGLNMVGGLDLEYGNKKRRKTEKK